MSTLQDDDADTLERVAAEVSRRERIRRADMRFTKEPSK